MLSSEEIETLGKTTRHSFSDVKYAAEMYPKLTLEGMVKLMDYAASKGIRLATVADLLKTEIERPENNFKIFEGIDF